MEEKTLKNLDFATQAVHAGIHPDPSTGAVMTPVVLSTTYVQSKPEHIYDYSRSSHPTRKSLEESLRTLEKAKHAYVFASGMAAIDSVCKLLRPGEEAVISQDLYGGVPRLFEEMYRPIGIQVHHTRFDDLDKVAERMSPATRLLWIETPSNPMLRIIDIQAAAALAHQYGALLVVDNTFATPYIQQPLSLGADIVIHSVTKYLNGHSDVLMGLACTNDEALSEHLYRCQKNVGALPGPWDCFMVLRGIKTLALRMEAHLRGAQEVVAFLSKHKDVEAVYYPGLPNHTGHEIAKRQMNNRFGGMLSFSLHDHTKAKKVAQSLSLFELAESLGGVESLVCHPITSTHASLPEERRLALGIDEGLLRLSVGIEAPKDLIDDLGRALDNA